MQTDRDEVGSAIKIQKWIRNRLLYQRSIRFLCLLMLIRDGEENKLSFLDFLVNFSEDENVTPQEWLRRYETVLRVSIETCYLYEEEWKMENYVRRLSVDALLSEVTTSTGRCVSDSERCFVKENSSQSRFLFLLSEEKRQSLIRDFRKDGLQPVLNAMTDSHPAEDTSDLGTLLSECVGEANMRFMKQSNRFRQYLQGVVPFTNLGRTLLYILNTTNSSEPPCATTTAVSTDCAPLPLKEQNKEDDEQNSDEEEDGQSGLSEEVYNTRYFERQKEKYLKIFRGVAEKLNLSDECKEQKEAELFNTPPNESCHDGVVYDNTDDTAGFADAEDVFFPTLLPPDQPTHGERAGVCAVCELEGNEEDELTHCVGCHIPLHHDCAYPSYDGDGTINNNKVFCSVRCSKKRLS
ncbi:hypothetical protein AGDE_17191 [Angomonas deanei]|uniref:Uncharacterized protein n=1 Tax=Angomonas deanei TaxID=59799 RepID=A0A7G2CNT5_9TRYP|nr:hypothetical protein AGDE_17191 [Angomonas deanei]CAD2220611.1 hypothetical protein, conserved [Angomonas deanei]|eukprot:EPY15077.1 hypothetical protein AGDE_17191 [Angomonas deanei]